MLLNSDIIYGLWSARERAR